jgi:hypothetical protein
MGMRIKNYVRLFPHNKNISTIERVEFISNSISYVICRGRCCNIVALKVHVRTEDEIDVKDKVCEKLESVFNKYQK